MLRYAKENHTGTEKRDHIQVFKNIRKLCHSFFFSHHYHPSEQQIINSFFNSMHNQRVYFEKFIVIIKWKHEKKIV